MSSAGLTVRNRDLWNALTGNDPVLARAGNWPLPVKAAYAIMRVKQRGASIVLDIEALRVGMCLARAAKDEAGSPKVLEDGKYDITPEDTAAINAEFNALLDEEVTLLGCRAVTLAELGDQVRLTAADLASLGPFVVEE